jgi:hypothetical protein
MPKARSIYKEKVLGLDVDLCHLPRKCKALVLCPVVHKKLVYSAHSFGVSRGHVIGVITAQLKLSSKMESQRT